MYTHTHVFMTLVKDSKAGLIQNHHNEYRDHCYGILQGFGAQLQIQHQQVGLYNEGGQWMEND